MTRFKKAFLALFVTAFLAACQTEDERAEAYYQSALTLLKENDVPRAMIQLRNVFDHNGMHTDARKLYADLLLKQGHRQEAYSQYLRLIEQKPDMADVRLQLAEMALESGNWQEAELQGNAALALAPDVPENQALKVLFDYRKDRLASDDVKAGEQVDKALALLKVHPDLDAALRVLIDWYSGGTSPERALPYIDTLLKKHPDSLALYSTRIAIFQKQNRTADVGTALKEMQKRFPKNKEVADNLVHWYVSQQNFDEAEAFLRQRAGSDTTSADQHYPVIQLLLQTKGPNAALKELKRLAKANAGTELERTYLLQVALLTFQSGATEEGRTLARQVVDTAEGLDLKNKARIALARMLGSAGDEVGSKALVDKVLETDAGNVDGLMLRAAWRLHRDDTTAAVTDLRSAQDQDPRNTEVLMLLAEAQQKLGNVELAEQNLAQAVEISQSAARESLVYARFEIARGKVDAAELVLSNSMQNSGNSLQNSGNLDVARLLGDVLLKKGDFDGAQKILDVISHSDNPAAAPVARTMRAALLFRENRIDESLKFLRGTLDHIGGTSDLRTALQMIQIQMLSGRFDDARTSLATLREKNPQDVGLRILAANIEAASGNQDKAISILQDILRDDPKQKIAVTRLYSLLDQKGETQKAREVLAAALQAQPDSRRFLVLRAMEQERDADYDDAIAVYEKLFKNNPDDPVVANNLASMLAYYRTDQASINRAYDIARRLRGSTEPAFLDTLGLTQLLKGEADSAVLNLQAAARGLPKNAVVAINLGEAYALAGRKKEAVAELQRGISLSDQSTPRVKIDRARALLSELES